MVRFTLWRPNSSIIMQFCTAKWLPNDENTNVVTRTVEESCGFTSLWYMYCDSSGAIFENITHLIGEWMERPLSPLQQAFGREREGINWLTLFQLFWPSMLISKWVSRCRYSLAWIWDSLVYKTCAQLDALSSAVKMCGVIHAVSRAARSNKTTKWWC